MALTLRLYFCYLKSKPVTRQITFTKLFMETHVYHIKVFILRHLFFSCWSFYGGHLRRHLGISKPLLYICNKCWYHIVAQNLMDILTYNKAFFYSHRDIKQGKSNQRNVIFSVFQHLTLKWPWPWWYISVMYSQSQLHVK